MWYLSVTLDQSHRSGCTVPADQVEQVRRWIANYHLVKEHLEKVFEINRELMRRQKSQHKPKKSTAKRAHQARRAGSRPHLPCSLKDERENTLPAFVLHMVNKGFDLSTHASRKRDARMTGDLSG